MSGTGERVVEFARYSELLAGNIYEVTERRILDQMRPALNVGTSIQIDWLVLRSETLEGPYQFYEGTANANLLPGAEVITLVPHLGYLLEAGYFYFIGLNGFANEGGVLMAGSEDATNTVVSFGNFVSGVSEVIPANGPLAYPYELTSIAPLIVQELTTVVLPEQ